MKKQRGSQHEPIIVYGTGVTGKWSSTWYGIHGDGSSIPSVRLQINVLGPMIMQLQEVIDSLENQSQFVVELELL